MHDQWLPIAAAAKELGISERHARRYAAKLADIDRTHDRTSGQRDRTLVRLDALRSMAEAVRSRTHQADTSPDDDRTLSAPSATLAVAYERIIQEKDARLAEMAAALEHERRQTERLTDALAREQQLRLQDNQLRLLAVPPEPDTSSDTSPDTAATAPKKSVGFWSRLFGHKEETKESNSENSG